ncbi:MAG: hypothetical protein HN909_06450 [Phycisphaerales bacterium]|nr:hypothetical protein [Phycisphaerales bacterium]MBT7171393.1 hypothetical protein [Phycisphaerales bacterium]
MSTHRTTHTILALLLMGFLGFVVVMTINYTPETSPQTASPRVLAQTPALAEIIRQLGGAKHLVGTSTYDRNAGDVPKVCDSQRIQLEAVLNVEPEILFTQTDPAARIFKPIRQKLPQCKIIQIPLEKLADLDNAKTVICRELGLTLPKPNTAKFPKSLKEYKPRILFCTGPQQITVAGDPTYIGDLIRKLGGVNAGADIPGPNNWRPAKFESILNAKPEILVIHSESFRDAASRTTAQETWTHRFRDINPELIVHTVSDPNWLLMTLSVDRTFYREMRPVIQEFLYLKEPRTRPNTQPTRLPGDYIDPNKLPKSVQAPAPAAPKFAPTLMPTSRGR